MVLNYCCYVFAMKRAALRETEARQMQMPCDSITPVELGAAAQRSLTESAM